MDVRRGLGAAAALLLVLAIVGSAGLSVAGPPAGAGLEVTGTGFLDTFPCPIGVTCTGSFQGTVNGELAGLDGDVPWTVSVALGSAVANFVYTDECPEPIGFAAGDGVVTAFQGGAPIGTYGPDPDGPPGLPLPVVELEAPFDFTWTRLGATAFLSPTTTIRVRVLRPGIGSEWRTVATDVPGLGTATFVPTNGEIPGCGDPEGLTAFIVGGDLYAS